MSEIVRYATEEYVDSKVDNKTDELSTALGLLSTYTTLEDNGIYYDFNLDLLEKDKTYSLINNLTEDPNGGGPVKLFIGGVQKGVISIDSNCTYITIGIRSSTNTLYYNNLITSCSVDLNTGEREYEELYSLSRKAAKSEVLTLTNTTEYTPTTDYHPATKKYVDENGLTPTAKTLLATLLQNIPYSTDQSANVTAFLQELGVDTTQS